jgi:polyhydroxyalkanoate synthesis regulator phasin
MENLIKKTTMAGLGLLDYSREKVESFASELVERGELSKSEESQFVKKMMDRAEKDRKEIEKKIGETVEKTMERMNVPTRNELEELKKEIKKMRGTEEKENKQKEKKQ